MAEPIIHDREWQRSQPERAADSILAQTLPAHGPYAEPHDPRTRVRDDFSGNGSIVIPTRAAPSQERPEVSYGAKLADPMANPRKGRVIASEGLTTRDSNIGRTFAEGFGNARAATDYSFEVQPAGQRSQLAGWQPGLAQPAWASATTDAVVGAFKASAIEQGGRNLAERGRQTFGKVIAPGTRTVRRNEATVED